MDYQEIIKQLLELEDYFEEGRKRVYNLRMQIEDNESSSPVPEHENEEAKLEKLLSKKTNEKASDKKDGMEVHP